MARKNVIMQEEKWIKASCLKGGAKKNEKGKKELTPTDKQVYVYNINT
jgi:hypothetical protein